MCLLPCSPYFVAASYDTTPMAAVAHLALPAAGVTLQGTLAGGLSIQMRLEREVSGKAGVYGYYYYTRTGKAYVPRHLDLNGTLDATGKLTLTETDNEGKRTGLFRGMLRGGGSRAPVRFVGTWTRPNGSRSRAVSLAEVRPAGWSGRTQSIEREEKTPRPGYSVSASWPIFTGDTVEAVAVLNRACKAHPRAAIARFLADLKKDQKERAGQDLGENTGGYIEIATEVVGGNTRCVSVRYPTSVYFPGAAHPGHYTTVLNVDRTSGRSLSLADLFQPGTDYIGALSRHCRDALRADLLPLSSDAEQIDDGTEPDPKNFDRWSLSAEGLVITFDPYQVASYAVGGREVILPWPLLKPLLRPDGYAADYLQ